MGISRRQKEIFQHIKNILVMDEVVPTVSELGKQFDMSQQAMSKNLRVLEREGLIVRNPGRHRSLELVEQQPKAIKVPLLGRIAAGQPLEAVEDADEIEIPESLVPKGEVYALEVTGESMIEDGILDGDIVIIRRQSAAFEGQTVVAVVNEEATLKRYHHEGNRIRLQPANAKLEPIFVSTDDAFEIRGVAQGLYRRFATD